MDSRNLEIRVFVVDGGSTDGSVEALRSLKLKFQVHLISQNENRGSAGGYNDGAKQALTWGADYILLVNNDTIIKDKNLLHDLIKTTESDPTIGLVSPKIYFAPAFEYQQNYKSGDKGMVLWYAGGSFDWKNVNSIHRGIDEVDSGKYDVVEEIDFASGTCALVKNEVFARGIFWDEQNLFAYFDDNDFQEKVKKAGFKLYYDGLTDIYHKVSQTSGIGSPTSDYYISRNKLIFGLRYAPLRTKLALLRQAISYLLSGRPAQKAAVIDFFLGKWGRTKRNF